MSPSKPMKLAALLLSGSFLLTGCMMIPAGGMTEQEKEIRSDLSSSNFMPASRQMRDNIETQENFTQAAFWSREYDLNPSDLEATIKLAAAVRKMGNPQRAIEITQTGRALYPRDPYLGAEYAAALIAAEKAPEAIQPLDDMLRIAPAYARLWSLKGAALDQQEKYDAARKHYARAMQITPNDPNVLTNIGLSFALSGDPQTAEGWLRRAAAMPGANPAVQQNLDLVLKLQGKAPEAEQSAQLRLPKTQASPQGQMPQGAMPRRSLNQMPQAQMPQVQQTQAQQQQAMPQMRGGYPQMPQARPAQAGPQAQPQAPINNRLRRRR